MKKSKNSIVPTREEWQKAINNWNLVKQSGVNMNPDYINLSTRQAGLMFQMDKDPKKIVGEPILIICEPSGALFRQYPYKGTILRADKTDDQYNVRVLFYPTDREEWSGERIENLRLYQVEQVRDVFLPSEDQLKDLKMSAILRKVNTARKRDTLSIQSSIRDRESILVSLNRDTERYQKELTTYKTQLKATEKPDLNLKQLQDSFEQFSKHKKIADAYINANGQMVVETTMLYKIDRRTQKENLKKPIGRYAFLLDTQGVTFCQVINLDYLPYRNGGFAHYDHPNISSGKICTGDNHAIMDNMIKQGNFYEMADFLILFLELVRQDGGSPYTNPTGWMEDLRPNHRENPFKTDNKLWELHNKKESKPMTEDKKDPSSKTFTQSYQELLERLQIAQPEGEIVMDYGDGDEDVEEESVNMPF